MCIQGSLCLYSRSFPKKLRHLFSARYFLFRPGVYPLAQFFPDLKKRAALGGYGYLAAGAGMIAQPAVIVSHFKTAEAADLYTVILFERFNHAVKYRLDGDFRDLRLNVRLLG